MPLPFHVGNEAATGERLNRPPRGRTSQASGRLSPNRRRLLLANLPQGKESYPGMGVGPRYPRGCCRKCLRASNNALMVRWRV
jgi:hypothetical protein